MNTIDTFDRNEVIKMAQECGLVIAEPAVNGAPIVDGRQAMYLRDVEIKALEVAVPHGWKLVPIALTAAMLDKMTASQAKRCNGETMLPIGRLINLSENKVSEALFEAYRAAIFSAPQPPQAERVPMTPGEIDGILRTVYAAGNHGRNLEHAFARAVEAHHKIGVK